MQASNIKFCILTMEGFKFTVMAVLTDLCIYLRVVWLAAMNLRCLQRSKELASLHSPGRQQDSGCSSKHPVQHLSRQSSPLPSKPPSSACCCGWPGAVSDCPEGKIYMGGCLSFCSCGTLVVNPRSQSGHLNGRSFVCDLMWISSPLAQPNTWVVVADEANLRMTSWDLP